MEESGPERVGSPTSVERLGWLRAHRTHSSVLRAGAGGVHLGVSSAGFICAVAGNTVKS